MCGIFGFIGRPTKKTTSVLYLLASLNEDRGKDSTGLAISNGEEFSFYKNTGKATDFLKDPKTIQLLNTHKRSNFMNVIGHTRQATTGAVTKENAHPFRIGRFIIAHNGIISNFDELQEKYKTNYLVDSQIIAYLLNLHEPIEVFEKLIGGWFVVPYFELENQTELNIAKHNAPLALAVLPDGSGMYYSSLKADLKRALQTAEIRTGVGETNGSKLYKYKWGNGELLRDKFKIYNTIKTIYNYPEDYEGLYSDPEFGYSKGYKYNFDPKKETNKRVTKLLSIRCALQERKEKLTSYEVNDNGLVKRFYAC